MVCTSVASKEQTFILVLILLAAVVSAWSGSIGVDYGLNGNNLPSPEQTVQLLCSRGITRVRVYEARPDVTRAFANSGIDLMIGVPNEDVPKLAASPAEALHWVIHNVLPFPTSGISAIIVGNEWLADPSHDPSLLVPAMINIYNALESLFFDYYLSGIKVSTSHALTVLRNPSFPPSSASFTEAVVEVMRPLLDFLELTGSFFMVNIFPYSAYVADTGVSLEFALFEAVEPVQDPNTGLNYMNLFDLQVDAVYAAIMSCKSSSSSSRSHSKNASDEHVSAQAANDIRRLPPTNNRNRRNGHRVLVGESGWASGGGSTGSVPHVQSSSSTINSLTWAVTASKTQNSMSARCECEAATVENARTYNQNLIWHVLQSKGTPAHPTTPIQAYVFALFEENLKPAGTEQHYGLFFPNGTAVYPINFHAH